MMSGRPSLAQVGTDDHVKDLTSVTSSSARWRKWRFLKKTLSRGGSEQGRKETFVHWRKVLFDHCYLMSAEVLKAR